VRSIPANPFNLRTFQSQDTEFVLSNSLTFPSAYAGLQAVDYFTCALQRLYEKGEDRYVSFIWSAFRLVQDIDDNRQAGYGVYYTQKNPLNASALEWRKQNKSQGYRIV
jgi:hypothetical protein